MNSPSPHPSRSTFAGLSRPNTRRFRHFFLLASCCAIALLLACGPTKKPCGGACQEGYTCVEEQCIQDVACDAGQSKCKGSCVDTQVDASHCGACDKACPSGQSCVEGACKEAPKCKDGESPCSDACVELQSDASHCGACGNACKAGETCERGSCKADASCDEGQSKCGDTCVDLQTDASHCGACDNACLSEQTCDQGRCVCSGQKSRCGDACVDLQSDASHCGACDNACKSGESCERGSCELQCPSGQRACQGSCVDTSADANNCGACGNACPAGLVCHAGSCGCPADQKRCAGACVDASKDPKHCGQCGFACTALEVCDSGRCKSTCEDGKTGCNGSCVDLKSDAQSCGACGNACGAGKACCDGTCVDLKSDAKHCGACGTACKSGGLCCDGACVDIQSDDKNCGNCGVQCPSSRSCKAGACECKSTCPGSNQCVDLQTDIQHCGACGKPCKSGDVCVAGVCETPCPTGQSKCSPASGGARTCHDLKTDPDHCGACSTTCAAAEACQAGACTTQCASGHKVCSRRCIDVQNDSKNCGGCGVVCGLGKTCQAGVCACLGTQEICDNQKDDDCDGDIDEGCNLAASYGSAAGDESVIQALPDSKGNIYLLGTFTEPLKLGTKTLVRPQGQFNPQLFIAKFDDKGKVLWANAPSGNQPLIVSGLALDPKGNAYIGGTIYSAIELTSSIRATGYGGKDVFVAAISSTGQWKWVSIMGNPDSRQPDEGMDVAANSKGEVFVVGRFTHAPTWTSIDRKLRFSNGSIKLGTKDDHYSRAFVAKLSAAGVWTWIKFPNRYASLARYVAIDANDAVYVGGDYGSTTSFGAHQIQGIGGRDSFLAKISSNGAWGWARGFGGRGTYDSIGGIKVSKSGVLVAGRCQSGCTIANTTIGVNKGYFARFSNSGSPAWAKENTYDSGKAFMAMDDAGNIYVSSSGKLHKLDKSGQEIASATRSIFTNAPTVRPQIYVSGSGMHYLYGSFRGSVTHDKTTLTSKGAHDIFLLRFR